MTKEELAARLNGREYCYELPSEHEGAAESYGLVVVFGYSDDNVKFRGAINDEVGSYNGVTVMVSPSGEVFVDDGYHKCDCDHCGYKDAQKTAKPIKAVWRDAIDGNTVPWTYKTDIPHATFDIFVDGELFCRGIVFNLSDVKETA